MLGEILETVEKMGKEKISKAVSKVAKPVAEKETVMLDNLIRINNPFRQVETDQQVIERLGRTPIPDEWFPEAALQTAIATRRANAAGTAREAQGYITPTGELLPGRVAQQQPEQNVYRALQDVRTRRTELNDDRRAAYANLRERMETERNLRERENFFDLERYVDFPANNPNWIRKRGLGPNPFVHQEEGDFLDPRWFAAEQPPMAAIRNAEAGRKKLSDVYKKHGLLRDLDLPSKLEQEVATRFPGGKRSPEDVSKFVGGLDVKPAEIEWSGIGDLVARKSAEGKFITKQDILEHLQQSKLPIEVKEYPSPNAKSDAAIELKEKARSVGGVTSARAYNLRMPGELIPGSYSELTVRLKGNDMYTAGHQGDMQSNTMAYVLQEQRVAVNGKKYAVSDNIQSDWATDLRRYGERGKVKLTITYGKGGEWQARDKDGILVTWGYDREDLERSVKNIGIKPFPFKSNWTDLIMKIWMKDAIDKGLDGISWGTGKQVNEWRGIGGSWNVSNLYDKKLVDDANRIMKKGKLGKVEKESFITSGRGNTSRQRVANDLTWEEVQKVLASTDSLRHLRSTALEYKNAGINPVHFVYDNVTAQGRRWFRGSEKQLDELHTITFTPELKEAFKKGKIFLYGLSGAAAISATQQSDE